VDVLYLLAQAPTPDVILDAGKALSEAQTLQQFQQAAIYALFLIMMGLAAALWLQMNERRKDGLKRELRMQRALDALAGLKAEESSDGQ
jgi:threonine/homoserine/homoserine lactone efflux protein